MSRPGAYEFPIIDSVLHPSDFSEASEIAFAHALKTALIARSRLTLFHVSSDGQAEWSDFPGVRQTLERWGLLAAGSLRSAVPALGIDVRKMIAQERNPVSSLLRYLDTHPTDLIVLASHRHDDSTHWLRRSVAEPVARKSGQATLFVPHGVEGFVSLRDGAVSLQRILIPVAPTPKAQPAVGAAARLVSRLSRPSGTFTLLHVGAEGDMPAVHRPDVSGWRWDSVTRGGDVVDTILDSARTTSADLIVMTTDGRNGFLDALRGSHSERILRRSPCPLLVIPETGMLKEQLEDDRTNEGPFR
jgi:nucleotide-binding universal stress UspA family protein